MITQKLNLDLLLETLLSFQSPRPSRSRPREPPGQRQRHPQQQQEARVLPPLLPRRGRQASAALRRGRRHTTRRQRPPRPRWGPRAGRRRRPRAPSSATEIVPARKCIFTAEDLAEYNSSETFRGFVSFLRFCAAAVRGVSCKRAAALPHCRRRGGRWWLRSGTSTGSSTRCPRPRRAAVRQPGVQGVAREGRGAEPFAARPRLGGGAGGGGGSNGSAGSSDDGDDDCRRLLLRPRLLLSSTPRPRPWPPSSRTPWATPRESTTARATRRSSRRCSIVWPGPARSSRGRRRRRRRGLCPVRQALPQAADDLLVGARGIARRLGPGRLLLPALLLGSGAAGRQAGGR